MVNNMIDERDIKILKGWEIALRLKIDNEASAIELLRFIGQDFTTTHIYVVKKLSRDKQVTKFYKRYIRKNFGRYDRKARKLIRKMLRDIVFYIAFHNEVRSLECKEEEDPYNLFISILEEIDRKYGIITNMKYCVEYFRKNYQHVRNRLRKYSKREIDVYSRN